MNASPTTTSDNEFIKSRVQQVLEQLENALHTACDDLSIWSLENCHCVVLCPAPVANALLISALVAALNIRRISKSNKMSNAIKLSVNSFLGS